MPELAGTFLGEEVYWIPGYEGSYGVTRTGKVISYKMGSPYEMKPTCSSNYYVVRMYTEVGKSQRYIIHRLVASTFLNLILTDVKTPVDHIDRDKSNNTVTNLRVCSQKQNVDWSKGFGEKDSNTHKECRMCKEVKPRNEFGVCNNVLDRKMPYCKLCWNKYYHTKRSQSKEQQKCL